MKVSFDFDDTLTNQWIKKYAKELIKRNIEVHITTSRYDSVDKYPEYNNSNERIQKAYIKSHDELFKVADEIGIKKENIHFTNMEYKYSFLKHQNFVFHLDDNYEEINLCRKCNIPCIDSFSYDFKQQCEQLIKKEL